jgi:chorismate mutase
MAHFYLRVNDRVNGLGPLGVVMRINRLNELILDALKERSQYPVCRGYFDLSLRRDEANPQRELESRGIDTIGWNLTYSKVVELVCPEGEVEDVNGVVAAERRLEELVFERIHISKKFPIPRDKQAYIEDIRAYAEGHGMDPDAVARVFNFLIARNEYVQELGKPIKSSGSKTMTVGNCFGGGWKQQK